MASNRKPLKQRDPNQLTVVREPGEDEAVTIARAMLRPSVQAATTLRGYVGNDLELDGLVASLTEQTHASSEGDLGRAEAMLTAQAHTLDVIFNYLARQAIKAKYVDHLDRYLKLGLRAQAQAQCRSTWEALAALKRPPTLGYMQQANIAHGPQQVNNVPDTPDAPSRGRNPMLQNKLLETNDGERLDPGAAGAPS